MFNVMCNSILTHTDDIYYSLGANLEGIFFNIQNMRNNCQTVHLVRLGEQDIEEVTYFTYLGAKMTKDGNTEVKIKTRINKARGALAALKNIWKTNKSPRKYSFAFSRAIY